MKITVDQNELLQIADEIQRNCDLLSYTDAENAEDDIPYYVQIIRQLADELLAIAQPSAKGGGA